MNADEFTKEEILSRLLQLEQRIEELEQENKRKDKKIDQLQEQLDQKDERIEEFETRLRKYENPIHRPVSDGRGLTSPRPRRTTKTRMFEPTAALPDGRTVMIQSGV